jgi:hypothetical protein
MRLTVIFRITTPQEKEKVAFLVALFIWIFDWYH